MCARVSVCMCVYTYVCVGVCACLCAWVLEIIPRDTLSLYYLVPKASLINYQLA